MMFADNGLLLAMITDNAQSASLFPHAETLMPAIHDFGQAVTPLLMLGAVIGAIFGGSTSWAIGRGLASLRLKRPETLPDPVYRPAVYFVRKAGWLLVTFWMLPFGGLFALLAGFFQARWWQVALALALGRLLRHY